MGDQVHLDIKHRVLITMTAHMVRSGYRQLINITWDCSSSKSIKYTVKAKQIVTFISNVRTVQVSDVTPS